MSSTLPTLEPMPAESELSRARTPVLMRREEFLQLGTALTSRGYELIGPQVRDSAIVYEKLASFDQLPAGWSEEQSGGHYRLKQQDNGTLFGYTVGPHSWKAFLYPAHRRLWCAERSQREVQVIPEAVPVENYALVGVRACELEALSLYDQVTLHTEYPDP